MRLMPGPSGDCLPYLAPQKSLRQRCQLIMDYTEINMQRRQEDLGCCLTSLAMKKCCTGCYHHGDGRKRHKMTHTIACVNSDAFYTTKPFQANYFFSCHSILFPFRIIIQNGIYSIRENVWKRKMQFQSGKRTHPGEQVISYLINY